MAGIIIFPSNDVKSVMPDPKHHHAYNTWIHEICEQSFGRLRWNAMLRLTHVEKALEELRQVEALGAAAAEIHGMVGDKRLDGREFDPFWSEAERL